MTTVSDALKVTSRLELAEFVDRLRSEAIARPEMVENERLEDYLEALAAYLRDLPGFVRNSGWPGSADDATWALVAAVITGAVVYE
jgi:hypothetical protein